MSDDDKNSRSVENFLKAVYVLQNQTDFSPAEPGDENQERRVSTNALADALEISPPSVTDMARRMVESNLVDYLKYYGVRLTAEGEAIALRVIRRHRLIELYLAEELGYDLHEVHDEAEELEHVVSDRFVEAIANKLGQPTVDPHGDPIPTREGVIIETQTIPLNDLEPDTLARISRFTAENSDMLQHILERGFRLGGEVQVLDRDPFQGPLSVQVDGVPAIVGYNVAACILVELG